MKSELEVDLKLIFTTKSSKMVILTILFTVNLENSVNQKWQKHLTNIVGKDIKLNPKRFFNYVKRKRKTSALLTSIQYNDISSDDPNATVDYWQEYPIICVSTDYYYPEKTFNIHCRS